MIKNWLWLLDLGKTGLAVLSLLGHGWAWNILKVGCITEFGLSLIIPFAVTKDTEVPSVFRTYRGTAFDFSTAVVVSAGGHIAWGLMWMWICISGPVIRGLILNKKKEAEAPK